MDARDAMRLWTGFMKQTVVIRVSGESSFIISSGWMRSLSSFAGDHHHGALAVVGDARLLSAPCPGFVERTLSAVRRRLAPVRLYRGSRHGSMRVG